MVSQFKHSSKVSSRGFFGEFGEICIATLNYTKKTSKVIWMWWLHSLGNLFSCWSFATSFLIFLSSLTWFLRWLWLRAGWKKIYWKGAKNARLASPLKSLIRDTSSWTPWNQSLHHHWDQGLSRSEPAERKSWSKVFDTSTSGNSGLEAHGGGKRKLRFIWAWKMMEFWYAEYRLPRDLAGFEPATVCFQDRFKMPRELGGGFEWKITVLDSGLPFHLNSLSASQPGPLSPLTSLDHLRLSVASLTFQTLRAGPTR